jgi:uncharacterized protein YecE (DUF72 family)
VQARAYVGTSGWNYKHWRDLIYPRGLSQKKWLGQAAATFDSVEVNTSFYRIPRPETVEAWQAATPPHFVFALKLWRGITHYRKLKAAGDLTERFLESGEALAPERRAPLLIQLPPNQGKDLPKLEEYVDEWRRLAPTAWEIAVEFRNSAWLEPDVYESLNRLQVALCIHDMAGKGDTDTPNQAPFVYVRRHGTAGGRYAGSYSPERIGYDAGRIAGWVREGRRVYVYYNNDIGGHAWWNARDLRTAISSNLT